MTFSAEHVRYPKKRIQLTLSVRVGDPSKTTKHLRITCLPKGLFIDRLLLIGSLKMPDLSIIYMLCGVHII